MLPFLYDIFDTQEDVSNDKMLDIKNSQLIGYDKGIVTWKVFATNILTKKNRYLFYAYDILSGVV